MNLNRSKSLVLTFSLLFIFLVVISFNKNENNRSQKADPLVDKLKLLPDFHADRLYSPGINNQGSWVAMAFDDKGRMIACDQFGYLYRLTIPPVGMDTNVAKVKVEKLDIKIPGDTTSLKLGFAHGLLYAFHSLYVMVNDEGDKNLVRRSGLYRLQDTDNDDQYDKITLIKLLKGEGEHGPHTAVLGPDKQSIYVIAGNFTKIPDMKGYGGADTARIDNLLPLVRDPNGHDNVVNTHGGWIAKTDSAGSKWELVASGFRNPFDMGFNEDGELFTYDSDMEWDIGLPWYRPTRICHVINGGEFGWRPGTDKWSSAYPDNLPAILNIGQGSPTSFFSGQQGRFPEKYRHALFAFDWSFGIIYALHLKADGSSYQTEAEQFVAGAPLPLTDGMIGPDGAMYFLTGGRRLESHLYRVYYKDNRSGLSPLPATGSAAAVAARKTRRQLEAYQVTPDPAAVDFAWPNLKNEDRFIRFAAMVAIEKQPLDQWKERALTEKDPLILTQAAIALARRGDASIKKRLFASLLTVKYQQLTPAQQIDYLRACELSLSRLGLPDAAQTKAMIARFSPGYPASTNEANRMYSKILVYLGDPLVVAKTLILMDKAKDDELDKSYSNSSDLIMRNPQYGMDIAVMMAKTPPAQQIHFANALSTAKVGWTPALREKYFTWFTKAFGYKGGNSYIGFIDRARKTALTNVPKEQLALYDKMSGSGLLDVNNANKIASTFPRPKGPGRRWSTDSALVVIENNKSAPRDLARGRELYNAILCASCHRVGGEGGEVGPDLTQLGTRFSTRDILESIIEPSKVVSDQFAATYLYLKDGSSVLGRVSNQDKDNYYVIQNPFTPQTSRKIAKKDVTRTSVTDAPSIMFPGLINSLNPDELKDLMAYLVSGGRANTTTQK